MTQWNGVLSVWKPEGWTSHDVVAKVRGILKEKRIGHTGTLDPQVTGVLPLCLGRATRIVEYLQEQPKQYEAVICFGKATDTEDSTGEITDTADCSHLTESQIRESILSFVGEIEQTPPMYSAVKVNGKRLYELAREGKVVERKSRKATIHDISILECLGVGTSEPTVRFRVTCSKGTYIRTLCVDIGRSLQVPSTMGKLVRTLSAGLEEKDSLTIEQIQHAVSDGSLEEHLISIEKAVSFIPSIQIQNEYASYATQGKGIPFRACSFTPLTQQLYRLHDEQGTFYGLFQVPEGQFALRAVKAFLPS
ncbi:tRNA pseudouridine(55) synthase TruB [Paenibacillus assamensis]|uniref:tRNA pseudouridine(55) synthase TruB n=1 Tax=Paenibacillus assamensis TaxID=311244 RepID=UPI000410EC39|nr:tRNA pseudouridine(55) synthase TruB [Paenibacillus assamensis]